MELSPHIKMGSRLCYQYGNHNGKYHVDVGWTGMSQGLIVYLFLPMEMEYTVCIHIHIPDMQYGL